MQFIYLNKNINLSNKFIILLIIYSFSLSAEVYYDRIDKNINKKDQTILLDTLEDNIDFTSEASLTANTINLSLGIDGFINKGSVTTNQLTIGSGSYFDNRASAIIEKLVITQGYDDYPSKNFNIIQKGSLELKSIIVDNQNPNIPWIENAGSNAFAKFGLASLPYILNKDDAKILFTRRYPYIKKYFSFNSSIILPFSKEKNKALFIADDIYLDSSSEIAYYLNETITEGIYPNTQVLSYKNSLTINNNKDFDLKIMENMLCGFKDENSDKYLVFENIRRSSDNKILSDVKVLSFARGTSGLYSKAKVEELSIQEKLNIFRLGESYIDKCLSRYNITIQDDQTINSLPATNKVGAFFKFITKNRVTVDTINIKTRIDISACENKDKIPALLFTSTKENVLVVKNQINIAEQGAVIAKNSPAISIDSYIGAVINNQGIIKSASDTAIFITKYAASGRKIINSGKISGHYVLKSKLTPESENFTFINKKSGVVIGAFNINGHVFTLENNGKIISSTLEFTDCDKVNINNKKQIIVDNIQANNSKIELKNYNTADFRVNSVINCGSLDIKSNGTVELTRNSTIGGYNSESGNLIINFTDSLDNQQPMVKILDKAVFNAKNTSKSKVTLKYSAEAQIKSLNNIIIIAASEITGNNFTKLPNNEIYNDFLYGNYTLTDKNNTFLLIYNLKLTKDNSLQGDIGWISRDQRFTNIKNPYKMEDVIRQSDKVAGLNIIEADKRHIYFVNLNQITIGKSYSNSKQNTIYALDTKAGQELFIVEFSTVTEKISVSIDGNLDGLHDINNQKVKSATAVALKGLITDMSLPIENINIKKDSNVIGNNAPALLIDMANNSNLTTIINNQGTVKVINTQKIKSHNNSAIAITTNNINGKLINNATISGEYSIYFSHQNTKGEFSVINNSSGVIIGDMQIASTNFGITNKGYIKNCTITALDIEKYTITNNGHMHITNIISNNNYNINITNDNYLYIEDKINCNKININNSGTVNINCHSIMQSYIGDEGILKIQLPKNLLEINNQPLLTTASFTLSSPNNEKIVLYPDKNAVVSNFAYPVVILKTKKLLSSSGKNIPIDSSFYINALFSEKLSKTPNILAEIIDSHLLDNKEDNCKYIVARIRYRNIDESKKLIDNKYFKAKTKDDNDLITGKITIAITAADKSYYTRGTAIIIGKKNEADFLLRDIRAIQDTDLSPVVKFNTLESTTLESILISANLYSDHHYQQGLYFGGAELELAQGIMIDKNVAIKTYSSSAIYINSKIKSNIYNYGRVVSANNAIEINGLANMVEGTITNYNKIKGDYAFYLRFDDTYDTDADYNFQSVDSVLNNTTTGQIEGKFRISGKNFSLVNSGTITASGVELDDKANLKIYNNGYIDFEAIKFNTSNSIKITNTKSGVLFCGTTDLVIDDVNNRIINRGILKSAGKIILNTNYISYGTLTAKSLLSQQGEEVEFTIAKNSVAQFSNVGGYGNKIKIVGPGKLQIVHSSLNGNISLHKDDNHKDDGELELVNDVIQQTGRFIAGKLISNNNYNFTIMPGAETIFTQVIQQKLGIVNSGDLELQQGASLSSYTGSGKLVIVVNDDIQTSEYLLSCANDVNFTSSSQLVLKPCIKNIKFFNKKIAIIVANKIKYDNKVINNKQIENLISAIDSGSILLNVTNYALVNNGKKITAELSLKNVAALTAITNKELLNKYLQVDDTKKLALKKKDGNLKPQTKVVNYSVEVAKLLDHILLQVAKNNLSPESVSIIKYLLTDEMIKSRQEISSIKSQLVTNNISQQTNLLVKQLLPKNSTIASNYLLLLPVHINKNIFNNNLIKARLQNIDSVTNKALIKSYDTNIYLEINNYKNICKLNHRYANYNSNSSMLNLTVENIQDVTYKSGLQLSFIKTSINKLQLANDYDSISSIMLTSYAQFKYKYYKLQLIASYTNNLHREQIKNNIFKPNRSLSYNSNSFSLGANLTWCYQYNNLTLETNINLAISSLLTPDFGCLLELHCKQVSQMINLELSSFLNYTYKITSNKNIKFGLLLSCNNYLQNNSSTKVVILDKKFDIYRQKYYLNKIDLSALAQIDINHKLIVDINLEYFATKYLVSKAIIHYYF